MEQYYTSAMEAYAKRMQVLGDATYRAARGEQIVLIYPFRFFMVGDMRKNCPETATLSVAHNQWQFPSGGVVWFRDMAVNAESLRGVQAEFIVLGGTFGGINPKLLDLITEKNTRLYGAIVNARDC